MPYSLVSPFSEKTTIMRKTLLFYFFLFLSFGARQNSSQFEKRSAELFRERRRKPLPLGEMSKKNSEISTNQEREGIYSSIIVASLNFFMFIFFYILARLWRDSQSDLIFDRRGDFW